MSTEELERMSDVSDRATVNEERDREIWLNARAAEAEKEKKLAAIRANSGIVEVYCDDCGFQIPE